MIYMNPFQAIIFMIFFLPLMIIKEGIAMVTEFTEGKDKKKLFWHVLYFVVVLLAFVAIILWILGYR